MKIKLKKCNICNSIIDENFFQTHMIYVHSKKHESLNIKNNIQSLTHVKEKEKEKEKLDKNQISILNAINKEQNKFAAKKKARLKIKIKNTIFLETMKNETIKENLQHGEINTFDISAPLGTKIGTVLKKSNENGREINYEQAECSCLGENERCNRCFGSGYYTKKIIEETNKKPIKEKAKTSNSIEVNFSNDMRGNSFSIRELGRFSSNPLHDDYD